MDIFDRRYYRMNRLLMVALGLWPYQPLKQRRVQWVLVHLAVLTVCFVQGVKLIQYWGNIDMMVECMVPMGVQIVACLKSSNCIFNRMKMGQLLDLMKKDWAGVENEAELTILEGYAKTGFLLGFSYVVFVYGSLAIYLTVPLTPQILDIISPLNETRPRQFLYEVEYMIFDKDDHYVSIMIHNYFGSIVAILIVVSVDAMLLAYVHHICGMFSIIGYRLENVFKDTDADDNYSRDIENEKIYPHIANCVSYHGQILEFARLIETSYSTSFLFQMAASMLMISATGLQVVSHLGSYDQVFRHGQFIIGQLFHLFVNSWPSQMLTDHTFRFRESLYFAKWYRFSLRGRHLLRLAMLRSLKPCRMTAGNLYVMSVESFGTVVQRSMSYFTVLVSLR
uniref:Odorant receptor n=1 Tax=Campoletis chlorideae TaxID=219166 RepID=A0A346D415_9HYME|nr:odorant receptor [Campoletis chlorideae]